MNKHRPITPLWLCGDFRTEDKGPNTTKDDLFALITQEMPRVLGALCQQGQRSVSFYDTTVLKIEFVI